MSEERRSGRRAPIAGVRVTYEGATGAQIEAEVLDLAAGGLFIRTETPLLTGKRIALDLHILGEPGPWSALGRVVWSRAAAEPGRPAGMGVKLIDVEDATIDMLSRLVETREPTAPGVGTVAPVTTAPIVSLAAAAPERERTLMGVGIAPDVEPPPPASALPAPATEARAEPAMLPEPVKVEPAAEAPVREQSLAIDLVVSVVGKREGTEAAPAPLPIVPTVARQSESGGGSARWVVVVLLIVVAAIAAYVLFDGFLKPMGR
jgi:uncharacterized protein (TIGR02266 family)